MDRGLQITVANDIIVSVDLLIIHFIQIKEIKLQHFTEESNKYFNIPPQKY